MTRTEQLRISRQAQRYVSEFDEYGREYLPLKEHLRRCRKCEDNVFDACKTLRQNGYDLSKIHSKRAYTGQSYQPINRWVRVRDVTHKEHGMDLPYKGVYKCTICESEKVADNSATDDTSKVSWEYKQ